jgi:hypothetical protein
MKHQAVLVEARRGEPLVDDIQRSRLLGYEEDSFALPYRLCDQVRDRLALAGPGRALHDKGPSALGRLYALSLARVGVQDRKRILWVLGFVEVFGLRDLGIRVAKLGRSWPWASDLSMGCAVTVASLSSRSRYITYF